MQTSDTVILKRRFKKVYYEINCIKIKIHKQEGFWIFKSHIYTIEELLNSEHHRKIYALTEKIGDDANNWYKVGKLSEEGRNTYDQQRDDVHEKLDDVNLEIQNRQPTWWEEVKGTLIKFIKIVIDNMPELKRNFLENLANRIGLPSPIRKILGLPYFDEKAIELE